MTNPYNLNLPKTPANHQPLSPLSFLQLAAYVHPNHLAVVHGSIKLTYAQLLLRSSKLAHSLQRRGFKEGDTISVLAPNIPQVLEAHYGVPMAGCVLNALNYRLDAPAVAFILDHADAKALLVDREFAQLARDAIALTTSAKPLLVDIHDPEYTEPTQPIDNLSYEDLLNEGEPDPAHPLPPQPADEWDAISLNYTSGTTGNPKGVVYHHRGAYLSSIGTIATTAIPKHPVYLWTLPMFHCNGWCFTWSMSVVAATHVCLRRVEPKAVFDAIADLGVTHMCGAPIVMNTLVNAQPRERREFPQRVNFLTAAAPPPAATIAKLEQGGFDVTHLYGLTETYGPAVICDWNKQWDALPEQERAVLKARQGVRYASLEDLSVRNPETMKPVPNDGKTLGEVMFRGNMVMKGYLKNTKATQDALADGWFHSGDLGVLHPDGYIQLTDRSKDVIISGGENISSIEVENALYAHPDILEAAVVAKHDEKWGEHPCAFVTLKPGKSMSAEDVIAFCRDNLAHFKAPRTVVFSDLPKTSTGKIQKFKLRDIAEKL